MEFTKYSTNKTKIFFLLILIFGVWNLYDLYFNWLEYAEKFRYIFFRIPIALFLIIAFNKIKFRNKVFNFVIKVLILFVIFFLLIPPGIYYNFLFYS